MGFSSERVFICGGGHQGLSMSAHLALNGVKVRLWNRTEANIKDIIKTGKIICDGVVKGVANIEKASSKIDEVISDFVMVATPSSAHKDIAKLLAPFVHKDMIIILNPGRTFGAVEFAKVLSECGVKEMPHIAETQTIVYTCRRSGSNSATIFALKKDVAISSLNNKDLDYIMQRIPKCLVEYFKPVDSIAITSLSNVGMILHCAPVLMNIGWIESDKVDFKYYYDGISKSIAHFIEKMDLERVSVASSLGYDIETVPEWLHRTYNSSGKDLYSCIRTTEAYKEIDAPPTIHTRYLLEDVPNGLVPLEFLGNSLSVQTPNISTIIDLASSIMEIDFRKIGRRFGIDYLKNYV